MSVEYAGYNPLDEDRADRPTSKPGLVYVTTQIADVTPQAVKGTGAQKPKTDADREKSGTQASPMEPQCEIIVRTAQLDNVPTQYASDHFSISLFVMICCFLPFGIVGLIKNHKSRLNAVAGDYDGAVRDSRSAFRYALAGCIIGSVCYTAFGIFAMTVLILTMQGKLD